MGGQCCKDECDFLFEQENKSMAETACLNSAVPFQNWTGWDCEGVKADSILAKFMGVTRRSAAPVFCKYSSDCAVEAQVKKCCPDMCAKGAPEQQFPDLSFDADGNVKMQKDAAILPNVSTPEGQGVCL